MKGEPLDAKSLRYLRDVDFRLAATALVACKNWGNHHPQFRIRVSDGLRDEATQARYVREGKSMTMNSKHLTGHALDFAILNIDRTRFLTELKLYETFDKYMQAAWKYLGFAEGDLLWGGHWVKLRDGVHWEIHAPDIL